MTTSIQCPNCKHYDGIKECSAFPLGIPSTIYEGHFDHKKPYPNAKYPGDHGIQFEPIEGDNAN